MTYSNQLVAPATVFSYKVHVCHMARIMLYLSQDKGRNAHDGRRVTSTTQKAWMEPFRANTWKKEVPLCTKVENGGGLHHVASQLVEYHGTGRTQEDTEYVKAFPVARLLLFSFQMQSSNPSMCYLIHSIAYGASHRQEVNSGSEVVA